MDDLLTQDDLVSELAEKAGFTKKDIRYVLKALVDIFEEAARNGKTIKVRSLGKLYSIELPERKGNDGRILPPTTKVIFRLSENIRFANRKQ